MMKLVGNRPHSCLARSCDAVLRTKSLGQNVRSQCWGGNVGWIAPVTKSTPRMSAALMHLCAVRNKTFNQFENTNAHQWTPCMKGSIFFAPTSQSTNLYFCPIRFCYDAKSILNQLIFSLSLQKPAQLRMRSPFILDMIKTTHIDLFICWKTAPPPGLALGCMSVQQAENYEPVFFSPLHAFNSSDSSMG